jgi:DNA-binding HxlR family transcriptional regulator
VDYALTGLGESLQQVMRTLKDWAEQHIEEVRDAQLTYDEVAA